ncbi:MAG: DUF115 domain-containing protein [Candidatus Thermoplasmatota archaeon]|nr:DUF115 domain-containing protein [Candidatus Thermoplasmatota archaeon]
MFYKDWKPFYEKIINDLKLNFEKDKDAAFLLDIILSDKKIVSIKRLEKLIKNKEIIVFGAGHTLEKSILKHKKSIENKVKISADGATSALLKHNIIPDIIVTDLDGKISDILLANNKGAIVIIHAHGDNIEKIKNYAKNFEGEILGTTQIDPTNFKKLYNFGGFTDGDRAVFLANHFKAKKIFLTGFNFDENIGEYSFADKKDKTMKLKKLKWCKYFIDLLSKENNLKTI